MTAAFIHGLLLALGLILPLGVQNVFVFTQGAVRKYPAVAPVALTAAICDTLLILLAVFGVSVAVMSFAWLKILLVAGGFLFLLYMGWLTWKSKPQSGGTQNGEAMGARKLVGFVVMISLLNPHAILDTVGVIGTSSLRYEGAERAAFTLACILLSWIWFFALAFAGQWVGVKDKSGRFLLLLNKVSAIVMWVAAVYLALSLFNA